MPGPASVEPTGVALRAGAKKTRGVAAAGFSYRLLQPPNRNQGLKPGGW
jgi:hypothetical protein